MNTEKLYNLAVIAFGKGLSVLGFIIYSLLLEHNDFKTYSLYFASFQIFSQVIAFQIPISTFRFSDDYNFVTFAKRYCGFLITTGLITGSISLFFFKKGEITPLIITATTLLTSFNIGNEYVRGQFSERTSFILSGLTGVSYIIGIVLLLSPLEDVIDVYNIIAVDLVILVVLNIYIWKYFPKNVKKINYSIVLKNWKEFSFGLYLNGILWYLYFNLPFIVFQNLLSPKEFTHFAQFLRVNNGLSTASAMLALAFQKETLNSFLNKRNKEVYFNKRIKFMKKVKVMLVSSVFLMIILKLLNLNSAYYLELVPFMIIFICLYFLSNLLLAEKKTIFISSSMLVGFIICCLILLTLQATNSIASGLILGSIYIGLVITLVIRIKKYERSFS